MTQPPAPLVLHVIHSLSTGGLENGLVNLINGMPATPYRHAVACIEGFSDFRLRIARPDVEVVALQRSKVGVWAVRRRLFALCRRWRPAILHSRNRSGLDALLPACLAGVQRRIHGEHGWDVDDIDGSRFKPALLRRLHAPLVTRYVTVSQDLQRYLVERIHIGADRIRHVCNGVDAERFAPGPRPSNEERPPELRGANLLVIGTVGRLQPVKDQATLLRAFAQLCRSLPGVAATLRLAIFGDGPCLDALRGLARTLEIAPQVCFAGAVNDVPSALRCIDVFALPSLNEGISNTVLEAMSCGLPVVATAVGGNPELVDNGRSGRLIAPNDAAALAAALAAYAADPQLRQQHGQAGRERVLSRFSLQAMVSSYQSLYDEVLRR